MEIDLSTFDPVYEILILSIIKKIKHLYSKYKIETVYKHYSLDEDEVVLFINNKKFLFNINEYIEDAYQYDEKIAFIRLQEKIEEVMHN